MEEVICDKCPKCGKKDFRHRVKTDDFICNKCGNHWVIVDTESEV